MNHIPSRRSFVGLSLLFALLGPACSGADETAPPTAVHDDALSGLVESERTKQNLVGFAMTIARADGRLSSAASGDAELSPRRPFDAGQRSLIGSVTKTFTAVVVHQLADEGKLSLDARVADFLPDQPRGDRILVRHLLSHRSGLPDYIETVRSTPELRARAGSPWTPAELIAIANGLPTLGEPGQITAYSNTNYIILGAIIERVTGASWEGTVRRRVIDRIGLTHTAYAPQDGPAHGYVRSGASDTEDMFGVVHPSLGWAAGGLASSTEDLARYSRALFDGKLVKHESLARMMEPAGAETRDGLTLEWGLGLARATVGETTIIGHGGDVPGYVAFIGMSKGNVVAAASNTDGADILSPSLAALRQL